MRIYGERVYLIIVISMYVLWFSSMQIEGSLYSLASLDVLHTAVIDLSSPCCQLNDTGFQVFGNTDHTVLVCDYPITGMHCEGRKRVRDWARSSNDKRNVDG